MSTLGFRKCWRKMAREGKVDDIDGAEYRRHYAWWLGRGRPLPCREAIMAQIAASQDAYERAALEAMPPKDTDGLRSRVCKWVVCVVRDPLRQAKRVELHDTEQDSRTAARLMNERWREQDARAGRQFQRLPFAYVAPSNEM